MVSEILMISFFILLGIILSIVVIVIFTLVYLNTGNRFVNKK